MYFPLFLPLWAETSETFCLGFPDHLIKQSCGSSFRFPFRVSVDVHCGTYVSVSKQFLHILWCCTIGEQITGECVSQHMKMEIFKSFQLLFCRPCHNTNCTRWLVCSVRSQADKGYFLVPVGYFLCSRNAVATCLAVLHRQIWLKTNGKNYVLKYITLRILSFLFKKWYTEQSNSKGGELTQWDLFEVTTRCSCKSGNRLYRAYFMMLSVGCAYNWCTKQKYSK